MTTDTKVKECPCNIWHVLGAGSKKRKKKHSGGVFVCLFLICSKDESICIEIWLKYRKHQGRQVERSKGEKEASVEGETKKILTV